MYDFSFQRTYFPKSMEKTQVLLKCEKTMGITGEEFFTFMIISRQILLRMRNVSDKVAEKIK
jgi:hypothetical protein